MRKALMAILLAATVATPVAAQISDAERQQRREERRQAREASGERQQRTPEQRMERRQQRQERQQVRVQPAPAQPTVTAPQRQRIERAERIERRSGNDGSLRQIFRPRVREERQAAVNVDPRRSERRNREIMENRLRERLGGRDMTDRQYRQERRENRLERREDRREWRQDRRQDRRAWRRDWRQDRRYDWQRYRYSNRRLFSPGYYYAPYRGHSYNRFSIGVVLDSLFFSNRYWLSDPWQYRLPPAYEGTRWVRYYDDVLLVDLYTGEVLDVIHDFFW